MVSERTKEEILGLKEQIQHAVNKNETVAQFLESFYKPAEVINEEYDLWHFAFKNANTWHLVEEKFKSNNQQFEMINYEDEIVDKSQPRTETEKIQIKPTKNKIKLIDEKSQLLTDRHK